MPQRTAGAEFKLFSRVLGGHCGGSFRGLLFGLAAPLGLGGGEGTPVEEKAGEGFAIGELAVIDEVLEFVAGEPAGLDALVLHGLGGALGESGGEEEVHLLGDVAGGGIEGGEAFPVAGAEAGFFPEFAFGGGEGLFAGVDASGGEFPDFSLDGEAELGDEQNAALGVDGEDDGGALVSDDEAMDFEAVVVLGSGFFDGKDGRAEHLAGAEDAHTLPLSPMAGRGGERA